MDTIKTVLDKYKQPVSVKNYISQEFQLYGLELAEKLQDTKHKALYIRLAKTSPRPLLDRALCFVSDSNARNKGALFMWKLKQLKNV